MTMIGDQSAIKLAVVPMLGACASVAALVAPPAAPLKFLQLARSWLAPESRSGLMYNGPARFLGYVIK